jgi:protein-S-isoprenylcysteine O-methyltransferase Ste14
MDAMSTPSTSRPTTLPWPPLLLVAVVVGAWIAGVLYPLSWPGIDDLGARILGYGLGAAGVALMVWALMTLSRAGTTFEPNKGADRLVTDGPFAWRRNPIYLGHVLILLGLAQVTYNVWFAILAPVYALAVFWLAILPEERHLEERFGDAYRAYKERTRRWL